MSNPLIVVVGAGPGMGASVARRFGREGYDAALISMPPEQLEETGKQLQSEGITTGWTPVDVKDNDALREAITRFGQRSDRIDVLHFNPSAFRQKDPLQLSPTELAEDMQVGVGALLTAVQAARPFMSPGARITATGSMAADEPWNEACSLGVQKAALRNLVYSIDTTLRGDGIRAVSVTIQGSLKKGTAFDPELIADFIYSAATQPESSWHNELSYDG
jgi:NAD(P)-dependent dehydrogenase (short-subunit alcohol dehydrogenase family)